MEERDPPPHYANNSQISKPMSPNLDPGTYVVQVAKDQIYRVPPPENARIAENYRNSPSRDNKRTRCWCFALIIVFIAIVIFIGGLLGGLFSIVLTPKDPRFSIQRFLLEKTSHPKYKITLQVYNPNSNLDISYKEGGVVSLSLRRQEIASGAYPTFHQPRHNTTVFGVALKGSKAGFPKEVGESKKSDTNKVHVAFSLTIHVLARMKMGLLRSGTMKYDVTCQLKVDTLAKTTTRVLSQQCQTKRR